MAVLKSKAARRRGRLRKRGRMSFASATPVAWKESPIAEKRGMKRWVRTFVEAVERSHHIGGPVRVVSEVNAGPPTQITSVVQEVSAEHGTSSAMRNPDLEDALKRARERGHIRVAEILNSEDMLSADEFADLLGTTRVTVNAKRQKRQVLGLEGAKRGFRFPRWQLGPDGKPFRVLPTLFERLGDDPWAVYRFLVQHHPELEGLTGREALERGESKQAIDAAESVARNFS